MSNAERTIGLIGPPGWDDPSPGEYERLSGHRVVHHRLVADDFGWTLVEIARFEPQLIDAARILADRGAEVVGIVGTPFGWVGLGAGETPDDRNSRIEAACGVPVVSAVSGVVDRLRSLGANRISLAVTYYEQEWKIEWAGLLARLGFTIDAARSLADLGLIDGTLSADDTTHWAPTPEQILNSVRLILDVPSGPEGLDEPVDAVVISGAGARTLALSERLAATTDVPVVASDTALYHAIDAALHRRSALRSPGIDKRSPG